MQILKLSAVAAAKWKSAGRDPAAAAFKKAQQKKARDMSRRHKGELVRIVGPDDEVLDNVQEPLPR